MPKLVKIEEICYLPHNLLIVKAGVLISAPAFRATCRDIYVASRLDWMTLPTKHSSILLAGNFDSAMAPIDA